MTQRIYIQRLEKLAARLSAASGAKYEVRGCSGGWQLWLGGMQVFRGNGEAMHSQMLTWLGVMPYRAGRKRKRVSPPPASRTTA